MDSNMMRVQANALAAIAQEVAEEIGTLSQMSTRAHIEANSISRPDWDAIVARLDAKLTRLDAARTLVGTARDDLATRFGVT